MSRAVLVKTLRDWSLLIIISTLAIVLFEIAIVRSLIEAANDLAMLRHWFERPLVRTFIRMALGADFVGDLTPTALCTFGLGHPLLYAVSWALLLAIASGTLAGEIGRGTADLLLALPVSRVAVYLSTSAVWLLSAVLLSGATLAGLSLGERIWPLSQPLDFARLWPVAVNFLALVICVAAATTLVSSLVSRRGVAIGIVLGGLLVSDVVNVLAPFWKLFERISFLGFLHYYRPLSIVRTGEFPTCDIAVLLVGALLAWLAGLWHFARRDIPAV